MSCGHFRRKLLAHDKFYCAEEDGLCPRRRENEIPLLYLRSWNLAVGQKSYTVKDRANIFGIRYTIFLLPFVV